ncbi:MAG: hypothetical protein AB7I41_17480 [Candidatus Sericytochromatia bacterium]
MDIQKTQGFQSAEPIKNISKAKAAPADTETHQAIHKQPNLTHKDQGPLLGKIAGAVSELNLLDENQPLDKLIDDAMNELAHGSNRLFGSPDGLDEPIKPFAEREAKMTKELLSKLNEKEVNADGKGWTYKFSNADLKGQINALKAEIKQIMRQREMGMTDCWGSMTNRQVACEAAIRALESGLKERSRTVGSIEDTKPKVQICGPFPWDEKYQKLDQVIKTDKK